METQTPFSDTTSDNSGNCIGTEENHTVFSDRKATLKRKPGFQNRAQDSTDDA